MSIDLESIPTELLERLLGQVKDDRITWANSRKMMRKRDAKEPTLPTVKMVDPDGGVRHLPVANGRNIPHNLNRYGPAIVAKKRRKGWKLYEDAAVAGIQYYSDFKSEKERDKYIERKSAAYTKAQAEYSEQHRNENQEMVLVMKNLLDQQGKSERIAQLEAKVASMGGSVAPKR